MSEEKQNAGKTIQTIILVLGSLGLLGGGGGAYLVNNNVTELQNNMKTTLAVVENNMNHMSETIEKLNRQVIDINDGFQQEFKDHLQDPNLHSRGMTKLKEQITQETENEIEKLEKRLMSPMIKQWEILNSLREKIIALEAKLKALEGS